MRLHLAIFDRPDTNERTVQKQEIMRYLIEKDSSLKNKTTADGTTALMFVCGYGFKETVKFMVEELKVNMKQTDKSGRNCFNMATQGGHLEILKILHSHDQTLCRNIDESVTNCFELAVNYGHLECAKYLFDIAPELSGHLDFIGCDEKEYRQMLKDEAYHQHEIEECVPVFLEAKQYCLSKPMDFEQIKQQMLDKITDDEDREQFERQQFYFEHTKLFYENKLKNLQNELKIEHDQKIQSLKTELAQATKTIKNKTNENSKLQNQFKQLQIKTNQLDEKTINAKISCFENQLSTARNLMTSHENTIIKLTQDLNEKSSELEKFKNYQPHIKKQTKEIKQNRIEIANLNSTNTELTKTVESLQCELYNYKDRIDSFDDQDEKLQILQKQVEKLEIKNEDLNDALSASRNGAVMCKVQSNKSDDKELKLKDEQLSKLQNKLDTKQSAHERELKAQKSAFEKELQERTNDLIMGYAMLAWPT